MHPSLSMLDEAIELARSESALLELDDVAGLEESVEKRMELIERAWAVRADCDAERLREQLMTLQELQASLDAAASREHAEARDKLQTRKKAHPPLTVYGSKIRLTRPTPMIMRQW